MPILSTNLRSKAMKRYYVVAKNAAGNGEKPWKGEMEVTVRPEGNGGHFDEKAAKDVVSRIRYTDRNGTERTGAHWGMDQIKAVTLSMKFPEGTTDWDKYVALNSFFSDLNKVLTDEQIVKGAHAFYFADEDAPSDKIMRYIKAMEG